MSVEWIEHKGKKILYIKYSGLSPDDMIALIHESSKIIQESTSQEILTLTDMNDCFVNARFMEESQKVGAITLPLTKKAAILGITNLKKILLKGYNTFVPKPRVPFDNIEEAKDWLVK